MEDYNDNLGIIAVDSKEKNFKKETILSYLKMFESIIKYSISSIIAAIIDIIFFKLFLHIKIDTSNNIMYSTILARIISSIANYILSKKVAFKDKSNALKTIVKYYTLVIIQVIMSGLLVTIIYKLINISETLIKIIIDTVLFFIGYRIQRKWIFKNKNRCENN